MAEQSTPFLKRYPWLYAISGAVLLMLGLYIAKQVSEARAAAVLHKVTSQDIKQLRPKTGNYEVTGGRLDYAYAQAEGYTFDREKDTKSTYDSFVPYSDEKTKEVIMFVEFKKEEPRTLLKHGEDPAYPVKGFFQDPRIVPDEIYQKLANIGMVVPRETPVMELFGGLDPARQKTRIIVASVLTLIVGGGPWVLMYLISRPKKRQKRFSERYPERRIY